MNDTSKASAAVAVALLAAITAIAVTALVQYPVTDAKQILDWMGPLIGVVTGAFVGYFFTRGQVQTAKQLAETSTEHANQSHTLAQEAQRQAETAHERSEVLSQAVGRLAGRLEPEDYQDLLAHDEAFRQALTPSK